MNRLRHSAFACRATAWLLAAAALAGYQRYAAPSNTGGEVTASVQRTHAAVAAAADLSDPASFADAKRGFVAAPKGQIKDEAGNVIWDDDAFAFVEGQAPATVNPSLWRQALLNNQVGLFKVHDRIWQLRGFDLANITLIEGRTGWIVADTLTSRETAAAAMAFARQHLGDKPVSAVIFTHSHVDHFGGALGVIAADEAKARGVPAVDQPTQEITLDGLRFVFHDVPGSEAPAEFTFYLPELQAFGGAELMSHTLHNPYTLRGAKVRDALDYVLHMHYGVLHHRQAPPAGNAHATLQLTKPFSLQMLTGGAGAKDLLLSDPTKIQGSRLDQGRFFALLDQAPGNFPIVTR